MTYICECDGHVGDLGLHTTVAPLWSGAGVHLPRLRKKDGACLISIFAGLPWHQETDRDHPDAPVNRRHDREIAIIREREYPDCHQTALSYRDGVD